jgi:hypothetical protein
MPAPARSFNAVTYAAADRLTRRPGVSERTMERAACDLRQPVEPSGTRNCPQLGQDWLLVDFIALPATLSSVAEVPRPTEG